MPTRPELSLPTLLPLILWVAAGFFPALWLSVLVHEIGHVFAARLTGFAVTSFGLGLAKPILSARLPGGQRPIRFYLCRRSSTQGFTSFLQPDPYPRRGRYAMLVLGGSLANFAALALLLPLWRLTGWLPLLLLAVTNAVLAVLALTPYSYALPGSAARFQSDGALALARLLGNAHRTLYSPRAPLALAPLWEAVGDRYMLCAQYCAAAGCAAEVGDRVGAKDYRDAAAAVLASLPPGDRLTEFLAAHGAFMDGNIHAVAGEWSEARAALADAHARFAAGGYADAAAVADAALCAAAPEAAPALRAAEAALAGIAAAPEMARHPALARAVNDQWLRTWLRAARAGALDAPPPGRLETLVARYEQAARRSRDHLADLRVYAALADYRREAGDAPAAAVAERRARDAAAAVEAALAGDPDALRAFRQWSGHLLSPRPTPSV